ncbi:MULTISPECIES: hypothetical protein [unclassified Frankia]
MLIDCDSCTARGVRCAGCMMTVLLPAPGPPVGWDAEELEALRLLADAGLLPPLADVRTALLDQAPRRRRAG